MQNEHGLHARPAAAFVQTAARYSSKITVRNLDREVRDANAKSIIEVLTAGINKGSRVRITTEGPDESQALDALADLIERGLQD